MFIDKLLEIDILLFRMINDANSIATDFFFNVITQFGNSWVLAPLLIGIIMLRSPKKHWKHLIIMTTIAIAFSGIINSVIKQTVRRQRPIRYFAMQKNQKKQTEKALPKKVRVVGKRLKYQSFPSGHANTAFCAATAMYLLYGGYFSLLFLLAALTAYSRVYMGIHFPLDALAGGIGGIISVWIFFHIYRKRFFDYRNNCLKTGKDK